MRKPAGRAPQRGRDQKRAPRYVLRVLTEGERTEPDYLFLWVRRNTRVQLDLVDHGKTPDALVRQAKEHLRGQPKRRAARDFDEIWCVFDTDEHENLANAMEEARQSSIKVAVSNPCFELWLILHVREQTAYISRQGVQRLSDELGLSDGKRIADAARNTLLEAFPTAAERAQALDRRHAGNNSPARSNPSTDVATRGPAPRGGVKPIASLGPTIRY